MIPVMFGLAGSLTAGGLNYADRLLLIRRLETWLEIR